MGAEFAIAKRLGGRRDDRADSGKQDRYDKPLAPADTHWSSLSQVVIPGKQIVADAAGRQGQFTKAVFHEIVAANVSWR